MAPATKSRLKTKKMAPVAQEHTEDAEQIENTDQDIDAKPGKAKKPIEIDEPEAVVAGDEKIIEEDPLVGAIEDEESSDEGGLDGEELNPFGDRWEE